jgi:hypothetical protein
MAKPRKLSRTEIEGLAAFFGCRVATMINTSNKDTYGVQGWWDVYIACGDTKEKIGVVSPNNPVHLHWNANDWTQAFQRISGISGADLWEQGKRGMR